MTEAQLERRVALLESENMHRRELFETRFTAAQTAIAVASAENEKRLEGLNESRKALDDFAKLMIGRAEAIGLISALEQKTSIDASTMREKVESLGKPNYYVGLSAFSAVLVMVGGLWTVTGLKIDTAIAPLTVAMEAFRANQLAQEHTLVSLEAHYHETASNVTANNGRLEVSANDRRQLGEHLRDVDASIAQHATDSRRDISDLRVLVTRLNVWLDLVHASVFPHVPAPPLKQP